jgi:hypothetical protein
MGLQRIQVTDPCSPTSRVVNVATAAQLTSAINDALPGDSIALAPGTYNGRWTITRSGTVDARITLSGPRSAILQGPDLTGTGVYLNGADYWTLSGFTVNKSLASVEMKNGANWNKAISLDVNGPGEAGVVVKQNSSHTVISGNEIHNTGMSSAQFGEGVYIGTTEAQWVNGIPDHSDSNEVYGNHVYSTTADGIQFMAGTTGTIVRKNTIDGAGMVAIAAAPPHWVLAMGNDALVDSNTAINALTYGMKVRRSSTANSWGSNVAFRANTMTSGRTQAAIYLETPPAQGMVVYCDNVRTDTGTLSNVACTP